MDCLEFRQILLHTPLCSHDAFIKHAQSCPACARQREEFLLMEQELVEALEVDPPDDLAERIMATVASEERRMPRFFSRSWLSVAASLFLLISVTAWFGFSTGVNNAVASGLTDTVLNHIESESWALSKNHPVADDKLIALFAQFGAVMSKPVGDVYFASPCWIRKQTGLHLVVSGAQGPVTVLLMPGEVIKETEVVEVEQFTGLIVPTVYGSMAIVGEKGERIEQALRRIEEGLMFNT